jgi:DNA topoisomerase-2
MYISIGHLLTSSNYNDTEKKVTGGRNGFGAKLTNIFSKKFIIEIADSKRKKKYIQEFGNNMSKIESPKITTFDGDNDYTYIIFEPDLKKFGLKSIDDGMVSLMAKRVYDTAGITPKTVKVYLDEK